MLAALLFSGCATVNKPAAPDIRYTYMILPKGKLHGYPLASPVDPELDVTNEKLTGGMCLPIRDWEARENYILELESFAEGK